jgi:hypothetical protein
MIPDMSHFLVVYLVLMAMVSAMLVIVWGDRVAQVSDLGDGLLNLLQYTLFADSVGDDAFAVSGPQMCACMCPHRGLRGCDS